MRRITRTILPLFLAVACRADLLVSRDDLNGIDRYSDNGVYLGKFIAPGAGGLAYARGVAVLPNGNVVVGDRSSFDPGATSRILQFSRTGTFLSVFSSDPAVDIPFALEIAPNGNLFVASAGDVSNVAVLDSNTGAVLNPNFTAPGTLALGGPQYMAFGSNNVLYLTDIAGHFFRHNVTTGAHISSSAYDNPEGVAFGPDNKVYLAQAIARDVLRLNADAPDGPAEIIPMGAFSGTPHDIKFGPNGYLYVLTSSEIARFDVSGANGTPIDSFGNGGEFFTFFQPVPEPSTIALIASGLAGLLALGRRLR